MSPRPGSLSAQILAAVRPDVTHAQIARELGCRPTTVRGVLHRWGLSGACRVHVTVPLDPVDLEWLRATCPAGVTLAEWVGAIVRDARMEEQR